MAAYIQCLLNSSAKIKQKKSEEAISKIQSDYTIFENSFGDFMSKKAMRPSLEVIGDVKNFFESSPDFLGVSIEKMRNLHGPSFNIATVKALLNLRTDMTAKEKAVVFGECKEILSNFSNADKGKSEGIFDNIDTKGGEAEFLAEMTVKEEGEGDNGNHFISEFKDDAGSDEEFDMEGFLKEGGVDLSGVEDNSLMQSNRGNNTIKKRDKVVEIKGKEDMSGYLYQQVSNVDDSSHIFGKIFSTVTDTVKMVADTVNKARTKLYFAFKNNNLYIYKNKDSDRADEEVIIRKIEVLNYDEDSKKSFYFLYDRKVYRLEAKNHSECEQWVKSFELIMSKTEEYLNLDRYVDEKIFTKVTGKSLFKDYETILEGHRKKLWEKEKAKRKAEEKKRKEEERIRIEKERKILEEKGLKKTSKVAAKKEMIEEPILDKHQSEMPKNKAVLDEPKVQHSNTLTNNQTFRTGAVQEKTNEVIVKKTVKPVGTILKESRDIPIMMGISSASRDDFHSAPDSPVHKDDMPLLMNRRLSDASDEEYVDFGINEGRQSEHNSDKIQDLVRLDDQRKESMYDIMMKKEESIKVNSRKNSEISLKTEEEVKTDTKVKKSILGGSFSKPVKTENTINFNSGSTKTYVGEPVVTTTCFGGCINSIMSLFRRN